MRVSKFIYLSAAVLSLSLTACGSKDTPVETTEAVIEEPVEDIGDAYVEDSYEAESEGDNGSSVRINLHNDNLEEEKVRVPVEYFKIDYLDYLSRYKKSVIDVFGYPKKDEKIKKLKNIVEFINAPGKDKVYSDEYTSSTHILIKDFFYQ